MNFEKDIEQIIKKMEESISEYRANVLQGKYDNTVQKFLEKQKELIQNLNQISDIQRTEKVNLVSSYLHSFQFSKTVTYYNLINLFLDYYLRKGNDKVLAEQIALQNKFIQNYTILDEVNSRLEELFETSKIALEEFKKRDMEDKISEIFVPVVDLNGNETYISKQNYAVYEKAFRWHHDMIQVLKNSFEQLQDYEEKNIEPELEELGEFFYTGDYSEVFLLSDQELDAKIEFFQNQIQELQQVKGKKKNYQFQIDYDTYQYVIPISEKAKFIHIISEMRPYLLGKKVHNATQNKVKETDAIIDLKEKDYQIEESEKEQFELKLFSMEEDNRKPTITIDDLEGKQRKIPVFYYGKYLEVLKQYVCSEPINKKEMSNLDWISFYTKKAMIVESINMDPKINIAGKEISYEFAEYYQQIREKLNELIEAKSMVDYEFAESLSEEKRLNYYCEIIRKIILSKTEPKLSYTCFGKKIMIPVAYLMTVKECESRIKEIRKNRKYKINEKEVASRTPIMQLVYYGRLIEKMSLSKEEPKMTVKVFETEYQIPEKYQENFEQCYKRMKILKKKLQMPKSKKIKVKKVRKPLTDFMKQMPSQLKLLLAAGFVRGTLAMSSFFSLASSNVNEMEPLGEKIQTVSEEAMNLDISQIATKDNEAIMGYGLDQNPIRVALSKKNDGLSININNKKIENAGNKQNTEEKNVTNIEMKQQFCSRLGSVVLPAEGAMISENPSVMQKVPLLKEYQNVPCTIVKVNIRAKDNQLYSVSYNMDHPQSYINNLLENGGVIESVGIVSMLGEENYKQTGLETGTISLDQVTPIGNNTGIADEIRNIVTENEKGLSK